MEEEEDLKSGNRPDTDQPLGEGEKDDGQLPPYVTPVKRLATTTNKKERKKQKKSLQTTITEFLAGAK